MATSLYEFKLAETSLTLARCNRKSQSYVKQEFMLGNCKALHACRASTLVGTSEGLSCCFHFLICIPYSVGLLRE